MLTKRAIDFLKPFTYQESASIKSCYLPLGGIYWEDEHYKEIRDLPMRDQKSISRLFSIRFKIWHGDRLSLWERFCWMYAQLKVPGYGLFKRLELSSEEREAQEQVEKDALEMVQALDIEVDGE